MNKQELVKEWGRLIFKRGLKGIEALKAVKIDGLDLKFVLPKDQTEKIYLEAVKEYGEALQYVHIQTEEICLAAIKNNNSALNYVNPEIIEQWRKETLCLGKIIEVDGVKYKLGEV